MTTASRTAKDWVDILASCGVKPSTAAQWGDSFATEVRPDKFSLGESEIDDFLSQVLHESALLERMEENLNYSSADRIYQVWPKRFKSPADAVRCVRNPRALANKVYADRLGNINPDDGWLYRGSGPIQVTGKTNFAALERITGIPLVSNPDLLRQPGSEALRVCIAWWEGHVPDAVMGNTVKVRRAVNGGIIGLNETEKLFATVGSALS